MNEHSMIRRFTIGLIIVVVSACGGGGGGGSAAPPPAPPPPAPPPPATIDELNAASRFAAFATFGLNYAAIDALALQGHENWLEDQFLEPVGEHSSIVLNLNERRNLGEFADYEDDIELLVSFRRYAWWHRTMTSPDVLRQRVAFALSEIFVVSDNVDALIINPFAMSNYYDMLLTHAFGNFRDLLRAVTLHPSMGVYLSHVNNGKADPQNNTFPDENYAREVMQLFSIGLFELELDGTQKLDGDGNPIPTYANPDIREFAKIYTGMSYGGPGSYFGNPQPNYVTEMQMFDEFHQPGEKQLLNGFVVPDGQTGMQDVEAGIDNLFNHPNAGPFFGKQLIQRLVTSNPSPAYIERVALAFEGAATGVRGDMKEVVRAVLFDPEATATPDPTTDFGKLREPLVRAVAMLRQLNAASSDGNFFNSGFFLQFAIAQAPLSSPSVFNFFLPAHTPTGEIAQAGLVAPEFQITTTTTIVNITNIVDYAVNGEFLMDAPSPPFGEVSFDFTEFVELADDVDVLIDRLDIVLTYGTLSDETRSAIRDVVNDVADLQFRAQTAIYLLLISPDYAVRV